MSKFHKLSFGLILFLTAACSKTESINPKTSVIPLKSFEKVYLTGGGHLHFIPSVSHSVELRGQDVSDTAVEVKGDMLYLTNKLSTDTQIMDIYIYTPNISGIQISGDGTVEIGKGFAPVQRFDCSIHGGGKLVLDELKIGTLDISIYGGGAVTVQVDEEIKAQIIGGGSILYLGSPMVTSNILGGGSIQKFLKQ